MSVYQNDFTLPILMAFMVNHLRTTGLGFQR